MRFEALLRAHSFMKVERPREIWEGETEDWRFIPLLGEMIAAGLADGAPLEELTLNAANVTVAHGEDDEDLSLPSGDFVAITVSGAVDFGPDARWLPSAPPAAGILLRLDEKLESAGARFAYVRREGARGSLTVFIVRAL